MKVCVEVLPETLSIAMYRVADALKATAPKGVQFVSDPKEADLQILHVISPDQIQLVKAPQYAVIQYCGGDGATTTGADAWTPLWKDAKLVWSYFDLRSRIPASKFYMAPMGVGAPFTDEYEAKERKFLAMTSGFVNGEGAEAIAEVAEAASRLGGHVIHIGPVPENFDPTKYSNWFNAVNVSDYDLVGLMRKTKYVSGLRWVEGFEMMTVEAGMCGAQPILFDRPDAKRWDRDGVYVKEDPKTLVDELERVMARNPVMPDRAKLLQQYSWLQVCGEFWQRLAQNVVKQDRGQRKRRLLWIGDAVAASGFAKATHEILEGLKESWDVHVLGLNYMGDPHKYDYPIYPAMTGGDPFGVGRTRELCDKVRPDLVVIQNDMWNIPAYLREIPRNVQTAAVVAIDGHNSHYASKVNELNAAIFWTQFGLDVARDGGLTIPNTHVIGLGVDTNVFYPMDRDEARKEVGLEMIPPGAFIVGNVNRNQPRKRLDLTVRYFCKWLNESGVNDAYLFLHVAPTGDMGYDLMPLMKHYWKGPKRLILAQPEIENASPESMVRATLNSLDVQVTTSRGEGWGLTTLEGMACKRAQMVGKFAALGEWPKNTVMQIACTSTDATPGPTGCVVGQVPDENQFVKTLDILYRNRYGLDQVAEGGYRRALDEQFKWDTVRAKWIAALDTLNIDRMVDA